MSALLFACLLVLGGATADIVSPTAGSTKSNQQTVAQAPPFGLSADSANGPFSSFPISLISKELLGPLFPLYAWESALDAYLPLFEPPVQIRAVSTAAFTFWDTTAPYHPTGVGLFTGKELKRPVLEHNDINRNIALSCGIFKVLNFIFPDNKAVWKDVLTNKLYLQVDDTHDPTTPCGVGNIAADAIINWSITDGFNQLGLDGPGYTNGNTYNKWNYSDPRPLGQRYKPVNGPYEITDPTRWQPLVIELPGVVQSTGAPYVQHHITPHIGEAKTLAFKGKLKTPEIPAASSDPASAAYKKQIDEVLMYSAGLTDVQKIQAEHFDKKVNSLGSPGAYLGVLSGRIHLTSLLEINLPQDLAIHDANIAAWGAKVYFDSVRPITAIRYLYGSKNITAWGGPKRGTKNITGNDYRSYLKTMQHSDYPSGSACYCGAYTEALKLAFGTNVMNFTFTYPAGSSTIEPGFTPKEDVNLYWPTWDDYADQCAWSRVIAGVHFISATKAGRTLCEPIGRAAYARGRALIEGTDTGPVDITSYF